MSDPSAGPATFATSVASPGAAASAARERWTAAPAPAASLDRYDRQRRIAGWDQDRLRRAHVLVAGAGAIGNEALKLCAQLGVGRLTVIDMDRIEHANLARTVLFRPADVGRPKATVAAQRARELNPDVVVEPIVGDLEHDLGLGRVREASAVLGCLDNLHARLWLARACRRLGRMWIDAAMDARAASVTVYRPQGPCYACGLGPAAWRRHHQRFSCGDGLLRAARAARVATVSTLSSLAAAFQVEALLAALHADAERSEAASADPGREGLPSAIALAPGERLHLSLAPLELRTLRLTERGDCPLHEAPWPEAIACPLDPRASASALAAWLRSSCGLEVRGLAFGYQLALALACPGCAREDGVRVPLRRLTTRAAACPGCCQLRSPCCVEETEPGDALWVEPLAALGIPQRAIVEVRDPLGATHRVELVGAAAGALS